MEIELLIFQFVVVHRPARMLIDCNALSLYNTRAYTLRKFYQQRILSATKIKQATPNNPIQDMTAFMMTHPSQFHSEIREDAPPFSFLAPQIIGGKTHNRTLLDEKCNQA